MQYFATKIKYGKFCLKSNSGRISGYGIKAITWDMFHTKTQRNKEHKGRNMIFGLPTDSGQKFLILCDLLFLCVLCVRFWG
jgi:hypothetical protein